MSDFNLRVKEETRSTGRKQLPREKTAEKAKRGIGCCPFHRGMLTGLDYKGIGLEFPLYVLALYWKKHVMRKIITHVNTLLVFITLFLSIYQQAQLSDIVDGRSIFMS